MLQESIKEIKFNMSVDKQTRTLFLKSKYLPDNLDVLEILNDLAANLATKEMENEQVLSSNWVSVIDGFECQFMDADLNDVTDE